MTSSRGAKLSGPIDDTPFSVFIECDSDSDVTSRSSAFSRNVPGVVSFFLASPLDSSGGRHRFVQLYADADSAIRAWSVDDGPGILPRPSSPKCASSVCAVGLPREHDGLMLYATSVGSRFVDPMSGTVLDCRSSPRLPDPRGPSVALELVFTSVDSEPGRKHLLESLTSFASSAPTGSDGVISSFISPPFSDHGSSSGRSFVVFVLSSGTGTIASKVQQIVSLSKEAESCTAAIISDSLDDQSVVNLVSSLRDGIKTVERFRVSSGFMIHPSFGRPKVAAAPIPPPPPPPTSTKAAHGGVSPKADDDESQLFTIRRKGTGEAEAIVFSSTARGRSPHKYSAAGVASKKPERGSTPQEVVVPLLHVLRKLARLGALDIDVPIQLAFGQLARLRALQRDTAALNAATSEDLERDAELADRTGRLLESLSGMGFTLPAQGKVPLEIEEIGPFISAVEAEFSPIITGARAAILSNGTIEYMGLQELFPIGSLVTSRSLGGLGGALVCARVVDSFFEPLRSMFGGRKFSFHLVLEVLVALAGEFISVSFEVIFEEWSGGKEIPSLPFTPLNSGDRIPPELENRRSLLQSLSGPPSYRRYCAGSFFPHVGGRGQGNRGAATAEHRLAAPGRLVVDTRRGLELGHAPASAIDEAGLAIAATVKTFRNAQRTAQESEPEEKRAERLRSAGLRMWSHVPSAMRLQCWPTVVAFSLAIKQWGHCLVDGLEPVQPSSAAWQQLVLPARTKEMLLAMSVSTLRGASTAVSGAPDESKLDPEIRDLLDRLHRDPRKTLSVESLASLFGRPLYSLSFAELGSSVAELEERLTDVLSLAAHWGALVLLDEGDALVERRQRGALLQNSMTGVLLRLLENFEGSLFITSNRASFFDPAALSRVTLAIRYDPLDKAGKRSVWRNALARVLGDEVIEGGSLRGKDVAFKLVDVAFDLEKLSEFDGSGRSVGAVLRLAIGLAEQRGCSLSQGVLDDALGVWREFHKDLHEAGAANDWTDEDDGGKKKHTKKHTKKKHHTKKKKEKEPPSGAAPSVNPL